MNSAIAMPSTESLENIKAEIDETRFALVSAMAYGRDSSGFAARLAELKEKYEAYQDAQRLASLIARTETQRGYIQAGDAAAGVIASALPELKGRIEGLQVQVKNLIAEAADIAKALPLPDGLSLESA